MRSDNNKKWLRFYDKIAEAGEVVEHPNLLNRRGIVVRTPHWEDANLVVESARPLVHSVGICCHVSGCGYGRIYSIKEREEYFLVNGTFPPTDNSGYLAAFQSVPSPERFSVVCGIGNGSKFSESECHQIINVLLMFDWYSPYRVYERFLEIDIPNLSMADLPKLGSILDSYSPLIKDMFGYKPSEIQVIKDMEFGKMWFGNMSCMGARDMRG